MALVDTALHRKEVGVATKTIRVSHETHARARRLADQRQTTLGNVIADAIVQMERIVMLDAYHAAAARSHANPVASAEYEAELAEWEGTIADGLEPYPYEGVEELLARETDL